MRSNDKKIYATTILSVFHTIQIPYAIKNHLQSYSQSLWCKYDDSRRKLYFTYEPQGSSWRLLKTYEKWKGHFVTLPQEAIEGMKLEGRDSILFTCDQSPVFVAKKLWLPYGCMCCGSEKELQTIPNRYRKIVLCRACCEAVKSYHETGVD